MENIYLLNLCFFSLNNASKNMDRSWCLLTKETFKENECPMMTLYDTLKSRPINRQIC